LAAISSQVEFATYGDYDWSGEYKRLAKSGALKPEKEPVIFQQGDYPNGIVLMRAGFGRVSEKFGAGERTLNYIGAGQIFGLREVVNNWKSPANQVHLQHSLRAMGYAHILVIPTKVIEDLVLPGLPSDRLPPPYQDFARRESEARSEVADPQSRSRKESNLGARIEPDVLEFLTQNRFFNGTATMVIDLERCTRCDDCVRACASTHDNNPRFLRHGPSHGRMMIANACMHCTDPVCMIGCPTGAIHRESFGGEVVINPATCIGCKACYLNCPYDAIRMVDVRDQGGAFLLGEDLKRISKATKCDLCVENHGGPACQRACPHGALERVDLNDLDAIALWLKR
jgi:Fe-S-cluster-containing dehydrogenase component